MAHHYYQEFSFLKVMGKKTNAPHECWAITEGGTYVTNNIVAEPGSM